MTNSVPWKITVFNMISWDNSEIVDGIMENFHGDISRYNGITKSGDNGNLIVVKFPGNIWRNNGNT